MKLGPQEAENEDEIVGYGGLISSKHASSKNTFFANLSSMEQDENEDPVLVQLDLQLKEKIHPKVRIENLKHTLEYILENGKLQEY